MLNDVGHDLIECSLRLPRDVIEAMILKACQPAGDQAGRRLALAKWILVSRKQRRSILPAMRFGEPTWEMVLDLYVTDSEDRRIDVTGLCLASGVAPTTALRYVDLLADEGLIVRVDDCQDGRRALIKMSGKLRSAIDTWLDRASLGLVIAGLGADSMID